MATLIKPARAFFAIAMAAFGLQFLIHALFGNAPAPGPPWTPGFPLWSYFLAIAFFAVAVSIAAGKNVRSAAILLAVAIFVRVLLVYIPGLAANIHDPGPWTSAAELLALCGAALVLAGVIGLGRNLFAAALLVFAVQHFMYARFVATLVPLWIPGRLFWAYLVGVAFVVAAIAIVTRIMGGLAATLLGVMFLLWVLILHLPRVAATPHGGNEWTSLFIALAMSGGAFLVAETIGGMTYWTAWDSNK